LVCRSEILGLRESAHADADPTSTVTSAKREISRMQNLQTPPGGLADELGSKQRAAPNRESEDGIRRCQRLPEVRTPL